MNAPVGAAAAGGEARCSCRGSFARARFACHPVGQDDAASGGHGLGTVPQFERRRDLGTGQGSRDRGRSGFGDLCSAERRGGLFVSDDAAVTWRPAFLPDASYYLYDLAISSEPDAPMLAGTARGVLQS